MENKQFIQIGTEDFKILKAGALTSEYERAKENGMDTIYKAYTRPSESKIAIFDYYRRYCVENGFEPVYISGKNCSFFSLISTDGRYIIKINHVNNYIALI